MNDPKLRYLVSNGQFCIDFLDRLAHGELSSCNSNAILNHGLAVHGLIVEVTALATENKKLVEQVIRYEKELRDIHIKEIDPIVSKRFDELKDSLISYIEEF